MEFNKNQFSKTNDKKVLHKVRKQWVVISMATLMTLGGGVAISYTAHADANQPQTTVKASAGQQNSANLRPNQPNSNNMPTSTPAAEQTSNSSNQIPKNIHNQNLSSNKIDQNISVVQSKSNSSTNLNNPSNYYKIEYYTKSDGNLTPYKTLIPGRPGQTKGGLTFGPKGVVYRNGNIPLIKDPQTDGYYEALNDYQPLGNFQPQFVTDEVIKFPVYLRSGYDNHLQSTQSYSIQLNKDNYVGQPVSANVSANVEGYHQVSNSVFKGVVTSNGITWLNNNSNNHYNTKTQNNLSANNFDSVLMVSNPSKFEVDYYDDNNGELVDKKVIDGYVNDEVHLQNLYNYSPQGYHLKNNRFPIPEQQYIFQPINGDANIPKYPVHVVKNIHIQELHPDYFYALAVNTNHQALTPNEKPIKMKLNIPYQENISNVQWRPESTQVSAPNNGTWIDPDWSEYCISNGNISWPHDNSTHDNANDNNDANNVWNGTNHSQGLYNGIPEYQYVSANPNLIWQRRYVDTYIYHNDWNGHDPSAIPVNENDWIPLTKSMVNTHNSENDPHLADNVTVPAGTTITVTPDEINSYLSKQGYQEWTQNEKPITLTFNAHNSGAEYYAGQPSSHAPHFNASVEPAETTISVINQNSNTVNQITVKGYSGDTITYNNDEPNLLYKSGQASRRIPVDFPKGYRFDSAKQYNTGTTMNWSMLGNQTGTIYITSSPVTEPFYYELNGRSFKINLTFTPGDPIRIPLNGNKTINVIQHQMVWNGVKYVEKNHYLDTFTQQPDQIEYPSYNNIFGQEYVDSISGQTFQFTSDPGHGIANTGNTQTAKPDSNYNLYWYYIPEESNQEMYGSISFYNSSDNNKLLDTESLGSGAVGSPYSNVDRINEVLQNYLGEGYHIEQSNYFNSNGLYLNSNPLKFNKANNNYYVYLNRNTSVTVSQSKTFTLTVHYKDAQNGNTVSPDQTRTVTFTRNGAKDLVNGNISWSNWQPSGNWTAPNVSISSPDLSNQGYGNPSTWSVTRDQPKLDSGHNEDVTVTYPETTPPVSKDVTHTLTIHYENENNQQIHDDKTEIVTYHLSGTYNNVTKQTTWNRCQQTGGWPSVTSPQIKNYGSPDRPSVGGNTPGVKGQDDVEVVKYPDGTEPTSRQITHTLTVNYRDQNGLPISGVPSKTEKVIYSQSGTRDKITGHVTYSGQWQITNGGWPKVISPSLTNRGYGNPSQSSITDTSTPSGGDKIETVYYPEPTQSVNQTASHKLTIHYENEAGQKIHDDKVETVNYHRSGIYNNVTKQTTWNSWQRTGGGWLSVKSPRIAHYSNPDRQYVNEPTPDADGKDDVEVVKYPDGTKQVSQAKTFTLTVHYIDAQDGKPVASDQTRTITYNRNGTEDLINGHISWNNWQQPTGTWQTKPDVSSPNLGDQGYGTPDDGTPDPWNVSRQLPNPDKGSNEQVTVKYPENKSTLYQSATHTLTIHYENEAGRTIHPNKVETVVYHRVGSYNNVLNQTTWSSWQKDGGWPEVISPQITNYGNPDRPNVNEPTPNIDGHDDIEVVKYPNATEPTSRQVTHTLTVNYCDQNGQPISGVSSKTETVTYLQSGTKDKINGKTTYSGPWKVTNGGWPKVTSPNLTNRGYGNPSQSSINDMPTPEGSDKTETVYYPETTNSTSQNVTHTLTIHYENEAGQRIHSDKTENVSYHRSGTYNNVTKQTTWNNWQQTGGWSKVESPQIANYGNPDRPSVDEATPGVNGNNDTEIVKYMDVTKPISHSVVHTLIVNYRDQNGQPIPGVPSKAEQVTYSQSGTKDKVTDKTTYSGPWKITNGGWPSVLSPNLSNYGYGKPSQSVINDTPTPNGGDKIETVYYSKNIPHQSNHPVPPSHPNHDSTTPVSHSVTYTLTVNYRNQNGNPISGVPSKTEKVTYTQSGTKDNVTGKVTYYGSWQITNGGWPSVPSPDLSNRGYGTPNRPVVSEPTPGINGRNDMEVVTYPSNNHKGKPTTPNNPYTPKVPSTPNVPNISDNHGNSKPSPMSDVPSRPSHTPTVQPTPSSTKPRTPQVPKIPSQSKKPRRQVNSSVHRHDTLINNKHSHNNLRYYQKQIKYPVHHMINHHKKMTVKRSNGHRSRRYVIRYLSGIIHRHYGNHHVRRQTKVKLPQTGEPVAHDDVWAAVLAGAATVVATLGRGINRLKHTINKS